MDVTTYKIPVWDTITASWNKVYGVKKTFWASLGMFALIMIGFGVVSAVANIVSPTTSHVIQFIAQFVSFLMQLGLIYMGIRHAQNASISYDMIFHAFKLEMALKIVGLYILEIIILFIPSALIGAGAYLFQVYMGFISLLGAMLYFAALVTVIYLSLRMLISMGFVLEKNMNPWEAIKQSFKASTDNTLLLFAITLLQLVVMIVSVIPLGIGLIWSIPFLFICYGMIYSRLQTNLIR